MSVALNYRYNIFNNIKDKAKKMPFPFINEFKKDKSEKKPQIIKFENIAKIYNKKHIYKGFVPYITSANLIIEQLIILANSKNNRGVLYFNTKTLVDHLNTYISNDNYITEECYKKTINRLCDDGLVYEDRTRYYEHNNNIKCYSGLVSGDNPAYIDEDFKDVINKAINAKCYSDFIDSLKNCDFYYSAKYKSKFKEGYKKIKSLELACIELNKLVYEKNEFKYINFELLELIAPFYEALAFAHRNKWEKADILKIGFNYGKRGDNYRNRYIYLNELLLSKITMISSKNDKSYKELKKQRRRRLLRLSRTMGIVLYAGLLKYENLNDNEYYALMNSKREFQKSFLINEVDYNALEEIYRRIKDEHSSVNARCIYNEESARYAIYKLCKLFFDYKLINIDIEAIFDLACELLIEDLININADNSQKWLIRDIQRNIIDELPRLKKHLQMQ